MMTDRDFWIRMRAHLIEQEKALTEQRAAVIGQRKAIERMLELPQEPPPTKTETLTATLPYSSQ